MKSVYAALFAVAAAPVLADGHASGDAAAGEAAFNKQCVACHVIVDDAGKKLGGKNGKSGPNLYNVANRQSGIVEGFRYGKSIVEAGEAGLIWDEANFVAYVQDPTKYLREVLDNKRARGKMSYKVRKEEDAVNLYAYLAQFAPADM